MRMKDASSLAAVDEISDLLDDFTPDEPICRKIIIALTL